MTEAGSAAAFGIFGGLAGMALGNEIQDQDSILIEFRIHKAEGAGNFQANS